MDFESRYKKLNDKQREAVDTIDGPVMVIAGPGTGKTELLAMRAANILKKTDALPENILCLTFTDAGSIAMKKRLTEIIGKEAYNVSVFTFHAFGSEIMNRYREYFNGGAEFSPADDLARHRIVTEILDSLDYSNPLRSTLNGKYVAIRDIIAAISDLKRASLTDGEFTRLLDSYGVTLDTAGRMLTSVFSERISPKTRDAAADLIPKIEAIDETAPLANTQPLKDVLASSLRHAVEAADSHPKTTPPLTAWKNAWMSHAKDKDKTIILKAQKDLPKLRALVYIYGLYLQIMQKAELYDYDDMIMNLVHAMELNEDLRFDLQEKYHYVMVDEFQDTNLAQMRILENLLSNPVNEDAPNILVVGDDDQAIYGFQGAEVGNILTFEKRYPTAKYVTLTDNYRSAQPILNGAREVILQAEERLEGTMKGIDKTLKARSSRTPGTGRIVSLASQHEERRYVASEIKSLLDKGVKPNEIAIIARQHRDLEAIISCLVKENIPISYDRRDNVLDDEVIIQLEHIGRIVHAINHGDHDVANSLLPELLSHPAWGIDPLVVWEISLSAHKNREHWLETMKQHPATKQLFAWMVHVSQLAHHLPLERMIDVLLGTESPVKNYRSPLKEYFFSDAKSDSDAASFTSHLKNLTSIRTALRDHTFEAHTPGLPEFLAFMEDSRTMNAHITSLRHVGEDDISVQLLSAHGSKGLEFDHVFVINATDSTWGQRASGRASQIAFPPHLRLRQYSDDFNERLRLFFVALTRARASVTVTYATENDSSKEMLQAGFLVGNAYNREEYVAKSTEESEAEAARELWYAPILSIPATPMKDFLKPVLKNYMLSATHVNSYLDVTTGGPKQFLLDTLLKFPHSRSPAASYGSAVHATLQRAHDHVRLTGSLQPEEDILHVFEKTMTQMPFTDEERQRYLQQGTDALSAFLKKHHDDFLATQLAELNFANQDSYVGDVHLTGKLDVVNFDKDSMTATVIDYKTGGVLSSWDKGDRFEKVKAYKYRQQLLFYKLLIENSREWRGYRMEQGILQFVEPDKSGQIVQLNLTDIDNEELERFKSLLTAVWNRIHNLSFPDTAHYDASLDGILEFEHDLLTNG